MTLFNDLHLPKLIDGYRVSARRVICEYFTTQRASPGPHSNSLLSSWAACGSGRFQPQTTYLPKWPAGLLLQALGPRFPRLKRLRRRMAASASFPLIPAPPEIRSGRLAALERA